MCSVVKRSIRALCKVPHIYGTSTAILFNYEIKSIILARPDFIKVLGVILERKLSFHDHIDAIIAKSMAMLGFLKRNSSEFSDPYTGIPCITR